MMISVIIPMHNAEKYIGRCLDSLAAQTFRDFEVVVVDDGSTDNSFDICTKYDNTWMVSRSESLGVGNARNTGIARSSGDLLFFLDADDYLLPHALQTLHDAYVSSGSQIVIGGAFRQSADGRVLKSNSPTNAPFGEWDTHCGKQAIAALVIDYIQTNDIYAVSHCWGRLYECKLIDEYRITFDETMRLGEDGVFNTQCLKYAKDVTIVNEPLYGFQMHGQSLSREPLNAKQLVHDFKKIREGLVKFFYGGGYELPHHIAIPMYEHVGSHIANLIISHLIYISKSAGNEDELRWQIDELLESKFVQDMLEHYVPKDGQDLEIPMLMKGGMPGTLIDRCKKRAADSGGEEENVVALTEKDVLLHRIKTSGKPVVVCGYDVVGWQIKNVLAKADIDVYVFTDRDEAKYGVGFANTPIIPMNLISADVICIVAAMSISDVVDELERHDLHTWITADVLLSGIDCTQDNPNFEIDDTKWKIESVRIAHAAYRKPDYVFIRSLDVMITERCSKKCKDCSNLMQYFEEPKDFDVLQVISDVSKVLDNVNEVLEARIMGGDAFMHKQWYRAVEWLCAQEKVRRVVLYTNGKIVPREKDLSSLMHHKAMVYMTDYDKLFREAGLKRVLPRLLAANNIWHKVVIPDVWIDCASIVKHNRTHEENCDLFRRCVATNLLTLADGKLFRCPFAASAWLLGAVEDGGYIDVRQADGLRDNIRSYLRSETAMPACDYCTGRILTNTIEPAVQTKRALEYRRVR